MFADLRSIVIDADPVNRQEMTAFLASHGAQAESTLATVQELPSLLGRPQPPQLVVVNLDPRPHDLLRELAPLVRRFPGVQFMVLSTVLDPQLLMDVMQAGISNFVPLPIQEDRMVAAIQRVAQLCRTDARARVIRVVPSVGGCGATTIACNIAAALAKNGKTALVDLDLVGGSVAAFFDVRPRYTIADLTRSADRLDAQLVHNALVTHAPSGVSILARPDAPEDAQRVDATALTRLLGVLAASFEYVVLDSRMQMDPAGAAAARAADYNVIVTELNVPSARNAERYVAALRRLGLGSERVRVVVSRYVRKGNEIEPEQIERALGLKIDWKLPNDYRNAIAAINYGQPVVLRSPRTELSTSLGGLAHLLNGREASPSLVA